MAEREIPRCSEGLGDQNLIIRTKPPHQPLQESADWLEMTYQAEMCSYTENK